MYGFFTNLGGIHLHFKVACFFLNLFLFLFSVFSVH